MEVRASVMLLIRHLHQPWALLVWDCHQSQQSQVAVAMNVEARTRRTLFAQGHPT